MCIKIICTDHEHEFNPSESLEQQLMGAHEVVVDFDPSDSRIDSFLDKIEKMANTGISCQIGIKVNTNNYLKGFKLERQLEKIKLKLDINEIAKELCNLHVTTDRKLKEISEMCLTGELNER